MTLSPSSKKALNKRPSTPGSDKQRAQDSSAILHPSNKRPSTERPPTPGSDDQVPRNTAFILRSNEEKRLKGRSRSLESYVPERSVRSLQRSVPQVRGHATSPQLALPATPNNDHADASSTALTRATSADADRGMERLLIYRAVLFATLGALAADTSDVCGTDRGRLIVQVL